jgi:hypothetical protein
MTQDYQKHGGAFETEAIAQHFIERLQRETFHINSYKIIGGEVLRNVQSANTFLPPGGVVVTVEAPSNQIPQIQALVMECMGENLLAEQLNSWGF